MDEWISENACSISQSVSVPIPVPVELAPGNRKRKRGRLDETSSFSHLDSSSVPDLASTSASASVVNGEKRQENGSERPVPKDVLGWDKQLAARRNFDRVIFEEWKIRPW